MIKRLFLTAIAVSVTLVAAGLGWVYWMVVVEPGDEIRQENIRNILGKESKVYYNDGATQLGVFFDNAHRQYVTFEEIPRDFVNALVASEDERFFSHYGFDPVGIGRAVVRNLQAGKVVQGGSTLTQQTAKNLFKRENRSIEAKLKELLFALRLEYHYPKEKIFEFYANQFFVSGNGHGLGVAARYYFDKSPRELTLVECAFIAGSVKRPNYYNPFIKKSSQGVEEAKSRGRERLGYVLGKMRQLGMIGEEQERQALAEDLRFSQGKVGFALDYVMDLVREALSEGKVSGALEAAGVANIATAGLRIVTSVDQNLQERSLSILRGELSRLDVTLRGYERVEVQKELAALDYGGDSELRLGAFLFGTVVEVGGKGKGVKISVELDKKLGLGQIDYQGLVDLLKARVKYEKNLWSEPAASDLDQLIAQLRQGDRLWVSVRDLPENGDIQLSLERYPQVQGGALVLEGGAIRAVVGGSENRFFNRAVQARRTMGSAFKTLVYAAALQLGWNSADMLLNSRNIFVLHGLPYFPRPDHSSPHDWVSMDWAGAYSENVATVWLLAHLCDRLNPLQFREVAEKIGLAPRVVDGTEESYASYSTRIRDRYGIQVNRETLREAAYRVAVENIEADFVFDGMQDEYRILKELPYGLHFERFREDVEEDYLGGDVTPTKAEANELAVRKKVLEHRYVELLALREELTLFRKRLEQFPSFGGILPGAPGGASLYADRLSGELYFLRDGGALAHLTPVDGQWLQSRLAELGGERLEDFWGEVKTRDGLSFAAIERVEAQVEEEYSKLAAKRPYNFEVLAQLEDFRVTVGLHYLIRLGRQLGITSGLEPVLSFPLGSNVVSLLETTRMYDGLVTGEITTFGEPGQEGDNDVIAILDRIEAEDGTLLYKPTSQRKRVIDEKCSLALGGILENVVKFGTGKSVGEKVKLGLAEQGAKAGGSAPSFTVPLLGKTGTANNYTNASFIGYVPGVAEGGEGVVAEGGYAVGVYVGFDDNRPMRRKATRISGALGALPTWSRIADTLVQGREYAGELDADDLSFYGLILKRKDLGQINLGVVPNSGGQPFTPLRRVSESARSQPSILTFGAESEEGTFVGARYFLPFWISGGDHGSSSAPSF